MKCCCKPFPCLFYSFKIALKLVHIYSNIKVSLNVIKVRDHITWKPVRNYHTCLSAVIAHAFLQEHCQHSLSSQPPPIPTEISVLLIIRCCTLKVKCQTWASIEPSEVDIIYLHLHDLEKFTQKWKSLLNRWYHIIWYAWKWKWTCDPEGGIHCDWQYGRN